MLINKPKGRDIKISETINIAGGNLARPTKFNAIVAPPLDLISSQKSFDVLCKTANIPETTMEPIPVLIKGHTLDIPGRVNQEKELSITFYLDEYHQLRQIFYDWIAGTDDRFYGQKTQQSAAVQDNKNLFGEIILKARDFQESLNEPMSYKFSNVFPKSVQGFEFNSAGTSEVLEFTVIFTYYRMQHLSANSDIVDEQDKNLD